MHVYLRILRRLQPYRGRVLLGLFCLLVATPLSLGHPWGWTSLADAGVVRRRPRPGGYAGWAAPSVGLELHRGRGRGEAAAGPAAAGAGGDGGCPLHRGRP